VVDEIAGQGSHVWVSRYAPLSRIAFSTTLSGGFFSFGNRDHGV